MTNQKDAQEMERMFLTPEQLAEREALRAKILGMIPKLGDLQKQDEDAQP